MLGDLEVFDKWKSGKKYDESESRARNLLLYRILANNLLPIQMRFIKKRCLMPYFHTLKHSAQTQTVEV